MAEFEVAMTGAGGYRFRVVYTVTPQSNGVLVAVTSQWMRTGTYFGENSGAAPYSLTIGGFGSKSGTRVFDGSLTGWQWIESTSVLFTSGTSTSITATFNTGTTQAGSGSINSLTVPIAFASKASFSEVAGPAITAFDAGHQITIHTNRQSTAFTHNLIMSFGGEYLTIATGVTASYNWTPPLALLATIPNAASGAGFIRTETYSGSTYMGRIDTVFTLRAGSDVVPSATGVTFADQNTDVVTLVGKPVQGLSRVKMTVTGAGVYSSTITAAEATMLGSTVPTGGEIAVTQSGNLPVTAKVTDSRGRNATWAGTLNALAYTPPGVTNYQARRSNASGVLVDDGLYLRVDLNAAVASLINSTQRNALTVRIFTRQNGTGPWTARNVINPGGLTYNSNVVITGGGIFSATASWDVRVQVQDKFATYIADTTVATASVTLDMFGKNVGVGKIWEQGALDVGAGGIFDDGMLVINSGDLASDAAPGIVELATQAEVDAGTDASKAVTPKQARDAIYSPHATASGTASVAASGLTTVNFPAGRFTVPPNMDQPAVIGGANVAVAFISTVTATAFTVRIFTIAGGQTSGTIHWTATQMRSGSASG